MSYNYVINLTFYAGSTDKEDTDRRTIVVASDKPVCKKAWERSFQIVNERLSDDKDGDSVYAREGLNIDTLIAHFAKEGFAKEVVDSECLEYPVIINGIYDIIQWQ